MLGGPRSACDIKGVLFDYICLFRSKDIQQDWKYKDEYDLETEIQVTIRKKRYSRNTWRGDNGYDFRDKTKRQLMEIRIKSLRGLIDGLYRCK